jgi:hypothetical protein
VNKCSWTCHTTLASITKYYTSLFTGLL